MRENGTGPTRKARRVGIANCLRRFAAGQRRPNKKAAMNCRTPKTGMSCHGRGQIPMKKTTSTMIVVVISAIVTQTPGAENAIKNRILRRDVGNIALCTPGGIVASFRNRIASLSNGIAFVTTAASLHARRGCSCRRPTVLANWRLKLDRRSVSCRAHPTRSANSAAAWPRQALTGPCGIVNGI